MAKNLSSELDEIVALKHWTRQQGRVVLAAGGRSGVSLAAFARRYGVDPRRLYWWRGQLSKEAKSVTFKEIALSRVHLPVRPAPQAGDVTTGFELVLRSGHVVRVSAAFDGVALRRLLEVLEKSGC